MEQCDRRHRQTDKPEDWAHPFTVASPHRAMLLKLWIIFLAFSTFRLVLSQALPNLLPLIVKSPYLNFWSGGSNLVADWPNLWNLQKLGWLGMTRIDGIAYQWLGRPDPAYRTAKLSTSRVTPTQTVFTYIAGPAEVTVTFLSPIEVSDPITQSMPFGYITVDVKVNDSNAHLVQVYMDITGEPITHTDADLLTWTSQETKNSQFHQVQRVSPIPFEEKDARAQDIVLVFGTAADPKVALSPGIDTQLRTNFSGSGSLTSDPISPPQSMGGPRIDFAIIRNLGPITNASSTVVFAIGDYRSPAIEYTTPSGAKETREYAFISKYNTIPAAIDAFIADYPQAKARADSLDSKILGAIADRSDSYKALISITARQAMASTELTVSNTTDGQWNLSDLQMFMRDTGAGLRVNPVEKLYASFPFFLWINATYAGYLLSPLFRSQQSSSPLIFSIKDCGENYPRADGRPIQHQQPVEHTSSMLIMTYAHARYSGDSSFISQYYNLLKVWSDYLVNVTMNPPDSTTIDGAQQANSTNLIVKGIIAIKAMAKMSEAIGKTDDSNRYSASASDYINEWVARANALSNNQSLPDNLNKRTTWSKVYNLYADALLGTSIVPSNIYDLQSQWYSSTFRLSTASGLPDNGSDIIENAAWTAFAVATLPDLSTQDDIISALLARTINAPQPFSLVRSPLSQDAANLNTVSNSPGLGGLFAPFALNITPQALVAPNSLRSNKSTRSIVGPVVGGVVGGLVVVSIAIWLFILRRRKWEQRYIVDQLTQTPSPFHDPESGNRSNQHQLETGEKLGPVTQPLPQVGRPSMTTAPSEGSSNLQAESLASLAVSDRLAILTAEINRLQNLRELDDDAGSHLMAPPSYITHAPN